MGLKYSASESRGCKMRSLLSIVVCFAAIISVQSSGICDEALSAPPPEIDMLTITSPSASIDLAPGQPLHITWQSTLPADTTYNIGYSSDGEKLTEAIAEKITASEYDWTPKSFDHLYGWVMIKATDPNGVVLAKKSAPISFIPKTAVVVSKANQRVFFIKDGSLKNVFICSTAQPKYDLEAGNYRVYSREVRHWSRKWEVWMPHSLFFHEGYALHATTAIRQLGRPASHGCVRLHPRDAETLFGEVKVGTPVIVLPKTRDCSSLSSFYSRPIPPAHDVIVAAKRQN